MRRKIPKLIMLIAIANVFNINTKAETVKIEAMECEYTDAYKEWLVTPESERDNLFQPPICKTENNFYNLVGNQSVVESYTSTKFDLRNYNSVTSMEDQKNTNLCWAFSTLESIESNIQLKKQKNYDLSEAHLELATQSSLFNSLVPFNRTFNTGGNAYIASAYFMNRVGPVLETSVPFSVVTNKVDGISNPTLNDISNKKVELAVNDIVFNSQNQGVCTNESITAIKKYLVSNGALSSNMYFELQTNQFKLEGTKIKDKFVNGEYYYYDGSEYINMASKNVEANQDINHGVTIIGWDDTIPKESFGITAKRNGAWLIKNSYGESITSSSNKIDMGNKGYYYISYDDINICQLVTGFYNIDENVESNIYFHDKLGGNGEIKITNQTDFYLANTFKKSTNETEKLTKISFYNFGVNQKYDLLYGTTLENMNSIYTGTTDKVGVITVDIDDINLTTESFSLGIKYYAKEDMKVPVYMNIKNTYFEMEVPKNASYFSTDGVNWASYTDGTNNYLLPLRGYSEKSTYSYTLTKKNITNENILVEVDYTGISDLESINYNIYDINDTELKNSLNSSFKIENNVANSKTISISMNDDTKLGDYIFVSKYKDSNIRFQFSVMGLNNKLVFTEYDKSPAEPETNKTPDLIVNNNPNNNVVIPEKETNITNNPKTGNSTIVFVIIICSISLATIIIYSNKKWAKNQI